MENSVKHCLLQADILSRLWDPFLDSIWFAQSHFNSVQMSQLLHLFKQGSKQISAEKHLGMHLAKDRGGFANQELDSRLDLCHGVTLLNTVTVPDCKCSKMDPLITIKQS